MKRFLIAVSLLAVFAFGKTDDEPRSQFLDAYYRGRYEDCHKLLKTAFKDGTDQEVWDQRIHLESDSPACNTEASAASPRAMALLHIGRLEEARSGFSKDWISLEGLAWLAR